MVTYIRSDLDFILAQIKIAEAHALYTETNGAEGAPLFGASLNANPASIPSYNIAWGLRTVDGTYNNLLPGQSETGASDNPFPTLLDPHYRTIMVDADPGAGVTMVPVSYTPGVDNDGLGTAGPGDVFDPYVRTISNLIVDQTLGNPSAILTGLQRGGVVAPANEMTVLGTITAAYEAIEAEFLAVSQTRVAYFNAATTAAANPSDAAAQAAAAAALANFNTATAALTAVRGPLDALLTANGIVLEGENIQITNVAPDEGLSAPFNSWFTLFGQFFDHGLDLVAKGGAGTVFIPLMPDDPLFVPGGDTNFMVLTRATRDANGQPINTTTSFVDQNQTYASHASHQVFLRQYEVNGAGDPVNTGRLIEGSNSGMATWADLKEQASDLLGIWLRDQDVGNIPLLATDAYGNFIPGPNGYPQVVFPGANPGDPPVLVEGNPAANGGLGISIVGAIETGHAFLADIAHTAVPDGLEDGDIEIGLGNGDGTATDGFYDNELLDAHFMAGDGRANENVGLTAVHHVFHSEHNRLVEHTKAVALADAQAMLTNGSSQAQAVAFLNEWLIVDVATVPASVAGLVWDGERLFQAAKFGTEMQYQHLVFEEFARKIQPNINVFLVPDGYDVTLNPSIVAEFAHVVYRFGHSMLTETIDRFDPTMTPDQISLIEGFLNPLEFQNNGGAATVDADIAAGAIIRGMTRQAGNQIDEFVTSALRNNLLGLPLDLATINLARGRDTGVPSLNEARREFYAATNQDALLKPYESWVDFAGHLKNEASIINFIAAYGDHALITAESTIDGKRDAALTIITGVSVGGKIVPADRLAFLNATGPYAGAVQGSLGGLENVDLWIGGLAEETMPFGGMLGSTFNFVFEVQMENLQSGDRFYYLQRLDGLHLFGEMENNSFAAMIERNTDATHLPSDVFSTPGLILEVNKALQYNPGIDDPGADGILLDDPITAVNESADNIANRGDPLGSGILTQLVIRDNPATPGADTNYLRYTGGDHVVLGGTDANDTLIAGIGDDTLHGDGGNDLLEGGFGNDIINGGDGDDIIKDSGGDDNIKAGKGNDVVHAGPGLDLVMGNDGQDFIFLGTDMGSEVFAGTGNDFIYGNKNAERILGNEGNDWIETGTFDGAPGDNFDEIFAHDTIDGHDVFLGDGGFDEYIGEGGDDIMVGSAGRGKMAGMSGFDWATYKDSAMGSAGVNADLSIPIIFDEAPSIPANAALDEYQSMEGLSGSAGNDILRGSNILAEERLPFHPTNNPSPLEGYRGSQLTKEGVQLINGLAEVLGLTLAQVNAMAAGTVVFNAGDIILGGDGNDTIAGQMGNDIIDGDKWLDVQIQVTGTRPAGVAEFHNSMTTLAPHMFSGAINPGQLQIVRSIKTADGTGDTDVAVFADVQENYTITSNPDGTIQVTHTTVTDGLESDGSDKLRNIEVLRFSDGDLVLGAPQLMLNTIVANSYVELFDTASYTDTDSTGTTPWTTLWDETNDGPDSPTGGNIEINGGRLRFDDNITGGETISRSVNLAGATAATLRFDYEDDSLDAASPGNPVENVVVEAWNGAVWQVIGTLGGPTASGTGSFEQALTAAQIGATSAIRFRAEGNWEAGENFYIDNVRVEYSQPAAPQTEDYETTFTEGAAAVAIASGPSITDSDDTQMASARIVLTNAQLDDALVVGPLPVGIASSIDLSVSGQIIVNLTGNASLAAYQTAIQAITFVNTSATPITDDRIINVTVNDGLLNSAPATTTVNVVAVNDAPTANEDNIITNFTANNGFVVPEWVMLANDSDPEGDVLNVTGATENDGGFAVAFNDGAVTATATNTNSHDYQYTLSDDVAPAVQGNVEIVYDTLGGIDGNGGANILIGNAAATAFNGAGGDDIILAGGGNDTITQTGSTGGRDFVDGQGDIDTYQLNGAAGAETFVIYSRGAAEAAFQGIVLNALTEIVITRNGSVIAELNDIEEIRVNTLLVTSPPGTGGSNGGDTIQVSGDFTATSLNFNTITIDGNAGDDTIDISSLDSAHRIVFRSNGGNDTIVGTLRPQDVIEFPAGAVPADYEVTTGQNGVTTMTSSSHSVSFTSAGGMPEFSYHQSNDDDDDDDHHSDCDDDEDETPAPGPGSSTGQIGTPQSDVLLGTANADTIIGFAGDDVLIGKGGDDTITAGEGDDVVNADAGSDIVLAGAGDDVVFGGEGGDKITAGAGNDTVIAGSGNDLVTGAVGDGDDTYFGDDGEGGSGIDTLDLSTITANLTVDLGNGLLGRGNASSTQSGVDTLWSIENVATGSGNDTITASAAVNVIEGGAGNDTFRFLSKEGADGDMILGFEPGDRLDVSGIDANATLAGNQSFTLVAGPDFTAAAQLAVTYETRADGNYTVVQGNVDAGTDEDFRIELKGSHTLTGANFTL